VAEREKKSVYLPPISEAAAGQIAENPPFYHDLEFVNKNKKPNFYIKHTHQSPEYDRECKDPAQWRREPPQDECRQSTSSPAHKNHVGIGIFIAIVSKHDVEDHRGRIEERQDDSRRQSGGRKGRGIRRYKQANWEESQSLEHSDTDKQKHERGFEVVDVLGEPSLSRDVHSGPVNGYSWVDT